MLDVNSRADLPPEVSARYLLERRLGGRHSRNEHSGENITCPAKDQSTTLRPSSQYRSHYTTYISATRPAWFEANVLQDLSVNMRLKRWLK